VFILTAKARQHCKISDLMTLRGSNQNAPDEAATAAGARPRWTRREQVELDGLQYDIYVAAREGRFIGVWLCPECGEHGAVQRESPTPAQASTKAQIALCTHHNLTHRRPRKPK